MSFVTLQQQAGLEWQAFEQLERFRILIGSATCGRAAGSLEVQQAFESELAKQGLSGITDIYEVGCLGMCYAEVLVEIRGKDGKRVLYQGVEPKHVPALIDAHNLDALMEMDVILTCQGGSYTEAIHPKLLENNWFLNFFNSQVICNQPFSSKVILKFPYFGF